MTPASWGTTPQLDSPSWVLDPQGVIHSAASMDELGIVGNGPNDTLGDFDLDRVQSVIDFARDYLAVDLPAEFAPSDLVTNDFIDASIGR